MRTLHSIKYFPDIDERILAVIWYFQNTPNGLRYKIKYENGFLSYKYKDARPYNPWTPSDAKNEGRWGYYAHDPWKKEGKPTPDLSFIK